MDQRRSYWSVIVLLSSLLAVAAVIWDWGNPLRWIVIFWFLLFCPGMAFAFLFPGKDQITRFFLMVVLSVALDAAVTQVVLYMGKWSPLLILLILVGFCWLAMLLKFILRILHPTSPNTLIGAAVAEIRLYFGIIQRGWWLILISVLVAGNFSLVYSYYYAMPKYEAVAQFVVSPNLQNTDTGELDVVDKRSIMSTYADILNSFQIRSSTLELLFENPDGFIEYKTSATFLPDENIIQFSVKGPNPETTAVLANSIGQHAIDYIKESYSTYDIDFLNKALVPIEPYQPRLVQDIVLALVIGLLIGLGLAIFRDQLSAALVLMKKNKSAMRKVQL